MLLRVGVLPDEALAAATQFHAQVLPRVLDAAARGDDLVLVFDPADHTHRDWRNGVVRSLGRQFAPVRVNAIAGNDEAAVAAAAEYLSRAPGLTGQLLPVDGTGAGPMLYQGG
jgi:hypothetical protein